MTATTIEVTGWADLEGLAEAMGEVGEQMAATTSYAVTWVCRPDGFETSPVCLLRPLAQVLGLVAQAFGEAGRLWGEDWRRLEDATRESGRLLRESDVRALDRVERVA